MKILNFLSVLFISLLCACSTNTDNSKKASATKDTSVNNLDGLYVGLEEMDYNVDPTNSKWKWYHLSHLLIKKDSVFLDQNPISIYKKDTSFSASDGAFYYYSGTLIKSDTIVKINLRELFCDYCGELTKKNSDGTLVRIYRTKEYYGKLTEQGIIINGYLLKKTNQQEALISEKPPLERLDVPIHPSYPKPTIAPDK